MSTQGAETAQTLIVVLLIAVYLWLNRTHR